MIYISIDHKLDLCINIAFILFCLKIKASVIWTFVKAGGLVLFYLLVFFQVIFTATQVATNLWLSEWANAVPVNGTTNIALYLGVYAGLGVAQGIIS